MKADDPQELLRGLAPLLWEAAPDANVLVDDGGRIVLVNAQAERLFDYPRGELVGASIELLVPESGRAGHAARRAGYETQPRPRMMGSPLSELTARRRDGTLLPVEIALSPVLHHDRRFVLAIVRDVSARRALEERMRFLSTHDVLTGLHNRAYLDDELARLQAGRRFPVSLLVVDVDRLKEANDRFGHAAGDLLIQRAAQAIKDSVRAEDLVARVGGDEFVVVLPSTDPQAARLAEARLAAAVDRLNERSGATPLSLSVGAATAVAGTKLSDAMKAADAQMYAAKRARRSPRS